MYRGGRGRLDLAGRCVIVVDDGIATGSSAHAAACQVARALGAARIVLAVPVACGAARSELRRDCDELVSWRAGHFFAVGEWYHDSADDG